MIYPAEMADTTASTLTTIMATVNLTTVEDLDETDTIQRSIWALIDIVLFIAITGGNILTITAILRRPLVVSNLFVLSLACSDLTVGLMTPYHMAFYLQPSLGKDFHHCIVRLSLVSLACIASMFNILGIAVDRFLAIVFPLHYPKIMTPGMAHVLIGGAWLTALAIATAPVYWNKWPARCQLGAVVEPLYVLVIHVPIFIILFSTMCGFYARILCEAWRHADKRSPGRWKSVQVLMLVMGSFTISYTPYFIVNILNGVFGMKGVATSEVYKLTNSLAMANSAINPIIYTWKNHEFKHEILRLISCEGCKARMEDSGFFGSNRLTAATVRSSQPDITATTTI